MADWRIYERFVASLMSDEAEHDATVIPNASLLGRFSGVQRQIDVLIDCRYGHNANRRTIVDAKHHKRPIDVKQVEEFEGMMRDVQASHGILVCANGYTAGALRRAQDSITIRLVPLSDAELKALNIFDYEPCSYGSCDGLVIWDASPAITINDLWVIFVTGKCDKCHRFNVWCWDCGERFALSDEAEYQCSCSGPWFWLTAIEEDSEVVGEQLNAVYLILVNGLGNHSVIDRRPLR
jgi:hypothetical protein